MIFNDWFSILDWFETCTVRFPVEFHIGKVTFNSFSFIPQSQIRCEKCENPRYIFSCGAVETQYPVYNMQYIEWPVESDTYTYISPMYSYIAFIFWIPRFLFEIPVYRVTKNLLECFSRACTVQILVHQCKFFEIFFIFSLIYIRIRSSYDKPLYCSDNKTRARIFFKIIFA